MSRYTDVPQQYSADWLQSLDGRTAVAQVMRERHRAFTDDLGGVSRLSYAQRSLVERALWLEYWMQQQEQALAGGSEFDVGKWTQAANALQGILAKLGLDRKAREVPDLASFIAKREPKQ
ncbi:hypothetical protein [Pseudomonas sp.]|uniref:hypothetical protein n=1 Tax=Pseudomonas sp. TaxID=306 RepID=UPI0032657364